MISVTSLNTKIKSLLEATFLHISVEGEVASLTYHSSGHLYLSIKDDKSSIKCVMWKSSVSRMKFQLKKGERIVAHGSVGVYTPRGEYQFISTHIEPYGKGALAVAFEQLKTKLDEKGYFSKSHKKPIPRYPSNIALVTASSGAALQDMLRVAQKRWASVNITVVDVLVQGDLASGEIARGIHYADTLNADIIVIGRGGGSSEDLWAFNEEIVADAIYDANTPIVSAVGHEVDILISDFVADMRAPTPSAAMEMILPDGDELLYVLDELIGSFEKRIYGIISQKDRQLNDLRAEFSRSSTHTKLSTMQKAFTSLNDEYTRAMQYKLMQSQSMLLPLQLELKESIKFKLKQTENNLQNIIKRFEMYNPANSSKYAWAQVNKDGKKISLEEISVGDEFELIEDRVKLFVKAMKKTAIK